MITQENQLELGYLLKLKREADENYEKFHANILARLKAGEAIEEGLFTIRVREEVEAA